MFENALHNLAKRGEDSELLRPHTEDFLQDGLLHCYRCKTPKQAKVPMQDKIFVMSSLCQCQNAEYQRREAERKHQNLVDELRRNGISDRTYERFTFEADDKKLPQITKICSDYVSKWAEMKAANVGLLLHGKVGSGKTFYAGCIANALISQGQSAAITNLPKLINQIQDNFEGRQDRIEKYTRFGLLVLDDLGAVRNTDYINETLFNIIDSRSRSGRPLIVTTNLTIEQLENPETIWDQRIFSRILEMCPIDILFTEGRRKGNRETSRKRALELLRD